MTDLGGFLVAGLVLAFFGAMALAAWLAERWRVDDMARKCVEMASRLEKMAAGKAA